jgi:hypothetical protein
VSDRPRTVSDVRSEIWDGAVFRVDLERRRVYLEFVDTVGVVRTDVDHSNRDPFTTSASREDLRVLLRHGEWTEITSEDVPHEEWSE